jgi:hypothetical protein
MELHDEIRRIAKIKHVAPALAASQHEFSIAVRDLMMEAEAEGISTIQRTPAFCKSIQTRGFLEENGIVIARVDGPKSKLSTTVRVHYKVNRDALTKEPACATETAEEWAARVTAPLVGLMKETIAEHGGTEGYLRWVRGDEASAT